MPNWTKEQSDAINKSGSNIIVSAGAGSGKTAVLSERVITKLKQNIDIESLLILTFTNAAAAEMKERIRNKIKKENLNNQLEKVDTADITTFDAYALSLVKKYSHLLNISPDISIVDASIMKIEKKHIIDEIFDNYYEKKDEKFLKFIDEFTLKDDENIKKEILKLNESLDNIYNKKDYLKNYINNNYSENKINEYINEYQKLLKEKQSEIKGLIKSLSFYIEGDYLEKIENTLNNLLSSNTYDEIKETIPPKLPPLPRNSEEEAKEIKTNLSNTVKELIELVKYESEEKIKESLYKTKDNAEIIIQTILKLDEKITQFKYEKNVFEFIDISSLAINLLENNKDIRNELKEKYQEILIDEYQDTNDIQEKFISYIEKNNVYMVGDIKQSIYRFRNANPSLFKNKYENYSKGKNGIKIDLNKNFRSRSNVLNNINNMFNQIMDTSLGGADYISSHQMIFGNTSYNEINKENYDMEILNYKKDKENPFTKEEIEIFTIANDIKQKIGKYEIMDKNTGEKKLLEYQDIAILIDRSSTFELYKKIFEYLNIPLTIYRDKAINTSDEIVLLKHIYNLILKETKDQEFIYSYTSLARSYLFEINDNEIFQMIKSKKFENSEIYQKCKKLKENINEKTNEQLINEIIESFDIYMKIIKAGNINQRITVIDSIISIAQNCDKLGYQINEFYDYLTEVLETKLDIKLSLNKDNSNSVKIMTIHASKGLEFPLCYFTALEKKFNISDLKNLFYFQKEYGFIIPYYDGTIKSTILKTLLKNKYMKEEISERLRLFYVALTRAREKIILISSMENPLVYKENGIISNDIRLKYISFQSILNSIYQSLEKYIKDVNIEKLNLTKAYNLSKNGEYKEKTNEKLNINELNIKKEIINQNHFSKQTHKLLSPQEKQNIEFGLEMHSIFENIDFKNPNFEGLTNYEKNKVKSFIDSGILNATQKIYKEYEFIYEDKEEYHGIIDLLLIKENENIIVDYKLKNIKDEAYINQLKGYKKYIESINNKPTKIYLYSIIDETLKQIN